MVSPFNIEALPLTRLNFGRQHFTFALRQQQTPDRRRLTSVNTALAVVFPTFALNQPVIQLKEIKAAQIFKTK